jgi:hypothetical protein
MSWADFTRYFGAVEVCDPNFLMSFTEGDLCRYAALSYSCIWPDAANVCGLKLLVHMV